MAVEIRELVIKALVVDDSEKGNDQLSESQHALEKEKIIQECVNQVLKILRKNNHR